MDLSEVSLLSSHSDAAVPNFKATPKCHSFKLILLFVALLSGFAILHFARLSAPSDEVMHIVDKVDSALWMSATQLPRHLASQPELSVKFLQDFYGKHAKERAEWLDKIDDGNSYATLYNVLVPEAYCPDIVRVGSVVDGGKWVCKPSALPKKNCSIYSFGLNNEVSFDKEIQTFNEAGCRIYGYDRSEMASATKAAYQAINGRIKQASIAGKTNATRGEYTVGDLLKENNEPSRVEMLKMDIESAEHYALLPFLDRYRTCQIFLEVHGSAGQMRRLLREIANRDYRLFFFEVNGNTMEACEYSFIHPDCMEKYGSFHLARYLGNNVTTTAAV